MRSSLEDSEVTLYSFLVVKLGVNFPSEHPERGRRIRVGWEKILRYRDASRL